MENLNDKPIFPTLRNMEVGDYEEFPIEKAMTVRGACSNTKLISGYEFRTKVDREKKVVTVYREK